MSNYTQKNAALTALMNRIGENLSLEEKRHIDATAWFLGPKAENGKELLELVAMAVQGQIDTRKKYMPSDPTIFNGDSDEHEQSVKIVKDELDKLLTELSGSIPLASYRNQSHMYWDLTLPGVVGYFAAMLYNQNNVAAEASPVTTLLEIQVGKDLCEMLGFNIGPLQSKDDPISWGHITCDGSIANGESMWAARNLKYLPVALAAAVAVEADLDAAKCVCVTVKTCQGGRVRLIDATLWQLLNLPIDEVIGLGETIEKKCRIDPSDIRQAIDRYSVQNVGLVQFQQRFLDTYTQATPVVFVPATAHYSWPKTAALIGLGTDAVRPIEVDLNGRMSMVALRHALCECLREGRPVLQVVAALGSTEEGAIDPLSDIVKLRKEFQEIGLNFAIHVDGAWGGYFTSMLRPPPLGLPGDPAEVIDPYPELYLSGHFQKHYAALPDVDSVTLDPHKSGFIPYPAGSLCYRNGAMRDLIAYTAPVVFHGGVDVTVGPYGIEGSKPGAAAASVYLSHKVIPLDTSGYGRLLGRCLFNSKRFYAALVTMDLTVTDKLQAETTRIHITPFQRLPAEQEGASKPDILRQKKYIGKNFVNCETKALIDDVLGMSRDDPSEEQKKAREIFKEMGSDLSIVTYAFNFSTATGLNSDLDLMNKLNDKIFRALSLQPSDSGEIPSVKMFVTASAFDPAHYGKALVDDFAKRAGVVPVLGSAINFLISTTQNPWLSTTSKGNIMIPQLIEALRETAITAANEIIDQYGLDKCH